MIFNFTLFLNMKNSSKDDISLALKLKKFKKLPIFIHLNNKNYVSSSKFYEDFIFFD